MINRKFIYSGIGFFLLLFNLQCFKLASQTIDHWETVIMANDIWSFLPGNTEPPNDWNEPGFDDSLWQKGPGGIGYGDGDDATVIDPVISLVLK